MMRKIKLFCRFAKPYTFRFVGLFVVVLTTIFVSSIYPSLFGKMVDEVFYQKDIHALIQIVVLFLGMYLINQAIHLCLILLWSNLTTEFLFDIRQDMFHHVLAMKGSVLNHLASGDVIYRMSQDAEHFMFFIHINIFYMVGNALKVVLAIIYLWFINPVLAYLAILMTPIAVIVSILLSKRTKAVYRKLTAQQGAYSSWLFEIISSLQGLKLLSGIQHVLNRFVHKNVGLIRLQNKANWQGIFNEQISSFIMLAAELTLYILSAAYILDGEMTIGDFTAAIAYFGVCVSALKSVYQRLRKIQYNLVSMERVDEILSQPLETQGHLEHQVGEPILVFDDVHFSYHEDTPVLSGINLTVNSGEQIALVGESGVGKSTLVNLIYKLYDVQQGKIYLDGIDIQEYTLQSLREQIGIVHQDSIFFNGSIRYNLQFSNEKYQEEKLWDALHMAQLDSFVHTLSDGLDTKIGIGGIGFSGGQKQRLTIARALVKDPPVLILDEATSHLDGYTESLIKGILKKFHGKKTILIIAHRESTILNADKVAVLSNGKIVGYDKHRELLVNCPKYQQLFGKQYQQRSHNEVGE